MQRASGPTRFVRHPCPRSLALVLALCAPLLAHAQTQAEPQAPAPVPPIAAAPPPAPPVDPSTPVSAAPVPPAPLPPEPGATGSAVRHDAAGNTTTVNSHLRAPAPEDLRAEFDRIDRDRDGAVSRDEAGHDKYLSRTFDRLDADRNGRLSFDEMLGWLDE